MSTSIAITVAICAAVTVAVRALPIVFLAGATLPRFVLTMLSFVPSGIMMAIVVLELAGSSRGEGGAAAPVVSAILAALVAMLTRSLFATVLVGVGCYLGWFFIGWP
uniref:AzlD domain-containing protein n=1 Tax=Pantoea sp. IMH TaxID=1267600 RepID=UPI0004694560|nr:AzlD domain-containing protein [Pantoea sp. IMH]